MILSIHNSITAPLMMLPGSGKSLAASASIPHLVLSSCELEFLSPDVPTFSDTIHTDVGVRLSGSRIGSRFMHWLLLRRDTSARS